MNWRPQAALPDRDTTWHLFIDDVGRPGATNMAVDYSLLRRAQRGEAFLRLYCWKPACISFGRNEPALKRYDRDAIVALGLDTVRRPTGGRAVWHEHELTYAVAAPEDTFGSLHDSYMTIHHTLAAALTQLGADVAHAGATRNRESLGPGACFASPVGGEILANDEKLVGSAQVREGGAFLQHGSILLNGGQNILATISRVKPINIGNATTLTSVLGRTATFHDTSRAIARQAALDWKGHWQNATTSPEPSTCFSFDDSAWTWRR